MAIGEKDRRPRSDHPRIRIVRFSKQSLEFGQETHKIEGVPTRVFSLAKTVADCFKYRNKVGLDVALETLRRVPQEPKGTYHRSLAGGESLPCLQSDETVHGGSDLTTGNARNIAASVRAKLLNIANREGSIWIGSYAFRFGTSSLPSWRIRLSRSIHTERGDAVPSLDTKAHRPTRDLDLLGQGNPSPEHCEKVFREICDISVADDGLVFFPETVRVEKTTRRSRNTKASVSNSLRASKRSRPAPGGYRVWRCCDSPVCCITLPCSLCRHHGFRLIQWKLSSPRRRGDCQP